MRIAFIVPALAKKGPVIVVFNIIDNLILMGYDPVVFYFDEVNDKLEFKCQVQRISFKEQICFDHFDIIHSHGFRPDRYVSKNKSKIRVAKTISTIHCDIFKDLTYTYNILIALVFTPIWILYLKKMDYTIAISNLIKNLYSNKFSTIHTIHNGVKIYEDDDILSLELIDKFKQLKERELKILYTFAVLTKRKGIDLILKMLKDRKDLGLVVVGDGKEKKELESFVISNGLEKQVCFHDFVDNPYNYCKYADVFVMPSRSEGFGLTLVEAAMVKTKIVCSDLIVFKELFSEEEVTFFELDSVQSLSLAISSALESKDKVEVSYQKSISNYSSMRMVENHLEFYKSVLNK